MTANAPRVLIDAFNLALSEGTGIAGYTRTLVDAVQAQGADVDLLYGLKMHRKSSGVPRDVSFFDDKSWDKPGRTTRVRRTLNAATALASGGLTAERIDRQATVDEATIDGRFPAGAGLLNAHDAFNTGFALHALTGRPLTVRMDRPVALAHWTSPVPVRVAGTKNIYTIHDLVPLVMPSTTLHDKARFGRLLGQIARDADHIVTVSEYSRADIIRCLNVPADRVTNTYQPVVTPGPPGPAEAARQAEFVRARLGLEPGGYFFFVGAIEPKKNIGRLIEAYMRADTTLPLVIAGHRAWKWEQELGALLMGDAEPRAEYSLGQGRRVLLIGYAARAQLMMLMAQARALVFPSLSEGFGLPVVEAMSMGVPVLTSNRTATAEVAAKAALLVSPLDPADIRAGLEQLSRDDALVQRLRADGLKRAADFSAETYGRRIADLYSRLGVHLP
jgi:glycosyltransferase involved in cell wall biosynthesis